MPLIPFPNVPNAPGVPALPRSATSAPPVVRSLLGAAQGALWSALQTDTRWGIFDSKGKPLADPSNINGLARTLVNSLGLGSSMSTAAVEYGKAMRISDFPVERGSFASYNKVETPASPLVTLSFSGSESDRAKFLTSLDEATKSTGLYSVVTPEVQYVNYSIESYSYSRRADRGATLLIVELTLKEIRQVSAQYTQAGGQAKSPKQPDAAPAQPLGKVQALNPVQSTLQAVANKITGLAESAAKQIASLVK